LVEQLDDADVPQIITGADQHLVGLLGARGSPTNRNAVGGTLNVMIEDCTRSGCPLVVQPLFVGSSVTAGSPTTLEAYDGTPAFASALTERRSFVSMSTVDDGARLFEFDPFDVSDIEDSPVATTTTSWTVPGLLTNRLTARYSGQACNESGCGAQTAAVSPDWARAIGYFKASNTGASQFLGSVNTVSLSARSTRYTVSAPSGRPAAKHRAGRRRTTAATIRSGAAIACMSATGTAAASSSTSAT
jgi:hypothetical protein